MTTKLRLRAEDAQDLAVIAAILQDARARVADMVYDPEAGRFAAVLARYRRELPHDPATCEGLSETDAVLTFECVAATKHRGLAERPLDADLTMLTITTEPGGRRLFHIDLLFDDGRAIQLRSDCIDCRLEDVGEPRGCTRTPCDHFSDAKV